MVDVGALELTICPYLTLGYLSVYPLFLRSFLQPADTNVRL